MSEHVIVWDLDLTLGRFPIGWTQHPEYVYLVISAGLLTTVVASVMHNLKRVFLVLDSSQDGWVAGGRGALRGRRRRTRCAPSSPRCAAASSTCSAATRRRTSGSSRRSRSCPTRSRPRASR